MIWNFLLIHILTYLFQRLHLQSVKFSPWCRQSFGGLPSSPTRPRVLHRHVTECTWTRDWDRHVRVVRWGTGGNVVSPSTFPSLLREERPESPNDSLVYSTTDTVVKEFDVFMYFRLDDDKKSIWLRLVSNKYIILTDHLKDNPSGYSKKGIKTSIFWKTKQKTSTSTMMELNLTLTNSSSILYRFCGSTLWLLLTDGVQRNPTCWVIDMFVPFINPQF